MYPHERSLVEKFQGRPFALIGVNSDIDRAEARRAVRDEALTWRSFFDGSPGPIASRWRIRGWPTLFLIDHDGVIRARDIVGPELDGIERFVSIAEQAR